MIISEGKNALAAEDSEGPKLNEHEGKRIAGG